MAAVPALTEACGPAGAPRLGSSLQRLPVGVKRLPTSRRADLQILCARGGQPGPKTGASNDSTSTEDLLPAIGTKILRRLPGTQKITKSRDSNVVFVAGATGRVGSRVVRELLKLGYRVRAGVRNVEKAQGLLQLADKPKAEKPKKGFASFLPGFDVSKLFAFLTPPSQEKPIELVECDLETREGLENVLGNAGVVVCSIGASEKDVLDITGPYRIDYKATKNLIEAATQVKVKHFVLVTSLGTTKFGWPASALNLFWGVLIWKAKAEKLLQESGVPFTIIRPGGMERPTDAYKETHNLLLAKADTYSGSQVSNLQVAELIACAVNNLELAENKIIEAIAETSAPLRPIEDMLAEIPAKGVPAIGSKVGKKAVEAPKTAGAESKSILGEQYNSQLVAAREQEEKARIDAEAALQQKIALERRVAELRSKAEAASLAARQAKALEEALASAAREGRALTDEEKRNLVASIESEAKRSKQEVKPARVVEPVKVLAASVESADAGKEPQDKSARVEQRRIPEIRFRWPWDPEPKAEPVAAVAAGAAVAGAAAAAGGVERKSEAGEEEEKKTPVAPSSAGEEEAEVVSEDEGSAAEETVTQSSVVAQDPPPETAAAVAEPEVAAPPSIPGDDDSQEEASRVEEAGDTAAVTETPAPPPPDAAVDGEQSVEQVAQAPGAGESSAAVEDAGSPIGKAPFSWPWQKASPVSDAEFEAEAAQDGTVYASADGDGDAEVVHKAEEDGISSALGRPQPPLSGYTDLNTAATLSPTQSAESELELGAGSETEANVEQEAAPVQPPRRRPQSPYTMYTDLRPPASPSPSPPRLGPR